MNIIYIYIYIHYFCVPFCDMSQNILKTKKHLFKTELK